MIGSDEPLTVWQVVEAGSGAPGTDLGDCLRAEGHTVLPVAPEALARELAATRPPHLLHAVGAAAAAALAALPARKRLPAIIVELRPGEEAAPPLRRFLRSEAVDRLLVPDDAAKARLILQAGIDPNKIVVAVPRDPAALAAICSDAVEYKAIRRREIVPHSVRLAGQEGGDEE